MSWCVVYTKPQAEPTARAHLCRQGFDVYMPVYMKERRHARKTSMVRKPLFPRYLFVRLGELAQWRKIESTTGVAGLVRAGEGPAALDEDVISEIRKREDDKGMIRMLSEKGFAAGELLRVTKPGLSGLRVIFEQQDDQKRVVGLLQLLGRSVRVRLDRAEVCAVP